MCGTLVIMISSVYPESTKRKNELKGEKTLTLTFIYVVHIPR